VKVSRGRISKQEGKPAVWNTPRYKELWTLALKAGDEQEHHLQTQVACLGGTHAPWTADCTSVDPMERDTDNHNNNGGPDDMDVDHMEADGALNKGAADLDDVVPLAGGVQLLQSSCCSHPVDPSSDGSVTIGAHYPSAMEHSGSQESSHEKL
jgi:hypothetical protein